MSVPSCQPRCSCLSNSLRLSHLYPQRLFLPLGWLFPIHLPCWCQSEFFLKANQTVSFPGLRTMPLPHVVFRLQSQPFSLGYKTHHDWPLWTSLAASLAIICPVLHAPIRKMPYSKLSACYAWCLHPVCMCKALFLSSHWTPRYTLKPNSEIPFSRERLPFFSATSGPCTSFYVAQTQWSIYLPVPFNTRGALWRLGLWLILSGVPKPLMGSSPEWWLTNN